ncbi:MAG: type I-B CRISPR-associated protein Cas5b [Clostridiales bacterium]
MNIIAFDLWSYYAHFKKPYTTTSPLTYSFPTRTAISGVIGALIGIDKDNYMETFNKKNSFIGLSIKNPVKKIRMGQNLIDTKKSMNIIHVRTQIKIEYLKNPCYRIYVCHNNDKVHDNIKSNLLNHSSVFTISLGLSGNIANFKYIGEYECEFIYNEKEFVEIDSIIPLDKVRKGGVDFTIEGEYFTEKIPIEMNKDRLVTQYGEMLFERTGKKIKTKPSDYILIKELNEKVCFI